MFSIPDWKHWRKASRALLWECLALSCNVDPRGADLMDLWAESKRLQTKKLEQHSTEWWIAKFEPRMQVADDLLLHEILRVSPPQPAGNDENSLKVLVSIHKFQTYAIDLNWELPVAWSESAAPSGSKNALDKSLSPKKEAAYLNAIGGLLGVLLGESPGGQRYSKFKSEAEIIVILQATYPNQKNLSKRTLEEKFSLAKQSLKAS